MDNLIQTKAIDFQKCCEQVKICLDTHWKGMDDLAKMNMLEMGFSAAEVQIFRLSGSKACLLSVLPKKIVCIPLFRRTPTVQAPQARKVPQKHPL